MVLQTSRLLSFEKYSAPSSDLLLSFLSRHLHNVLKNTFLHYLSTRDSKPLP